MTEPQVASSDATNIESSIKREGDTYVINGTKWWTSGAMDPRCKVLIVMGKTDFTAAKHKQQSMIIVDTHTPGVHIRRPLMVFGFDDAPHGHAEVSFVNVRVPAKNILLGEGRGFEIAQGRLGPGRLHHCMRLIGAAERGMQMMAQRALKSVWKVDCRTRFIYFRYCKVMHRPDILPLLRARGLRCSVKPASRSTLYFRDHVIQTFAQITKSISQIGAGGLSSCTNRPCLVSRTIIPPL
nr:putative acyl-coa dehydrogenase ibr3 [Quercus suber]